MDEHIKELLARMEEEREALKIHGYSFPAMFAAITFLLRHAQIPGIMAQTPQANRRKIPDMTREEGPS